MPGVGGVHMENEGPGVGEAAYMQSASPGVVGVSMQNASHGAGGVYMQNWSFSKPGTVVDITKVAKSFTPFECNFLFLVSLVVMIFIHRVFVCLYHCQIHFHLICVSHGFEFVN